MGRDQLVELGLSERQIDYAIDQDRYHVVHPGVYLIGNPVLSDLGSLSAAVLAGGEGAALIRRSAAQVRGTFKGYDGPIEIAVPRPDPPRLKGVVARTATFLPYEVGSVAGIATTSLARTAFDLCKDLKHEELIRPYEEARKKGLTVNQVKRILDLHKGERGTTRLRRLLERDLRLAGWANGGYEDAFSDWLLTLRIPLPERNRLVELADGTTRQADLLWRDARLIIELDYHSHHGGNRRQVTIDHQRDRDLREVGWAVEHFTSDEFEDDRPRVERDLRRLLGSV